MKIFNSEILCKSVLLFSMLFSFLATAEELDRKQIDQEVNRILRVSKQVVGTDQQMAKRSMVLFNLYLDSAKEFRFAYAISHLTLAIETSATNARAEKLLNSISFYSSYPLGKAFHDWGMGLKKINRGMVKRIHFSYFLTKWAYRNKVDLSQIYDSISSEEAKVLFVEMSGLFPYFQEIHEASALKTSLDKNHQQQHLEAFVNWEHSYFIQPRMQRLFDRMPRMMQYFLRNVPDKTEKLSEIFAKLRTSFSLKCTGPDNRMLTTDFMDDSIRKAQARRFYSLLETINFDPNYSCYDDAYYVSSFPFAFFENPEKFVKSYYKAISLEADGSSLESWLYRQYRDIPLEEFAKIPSLNIPIAQFDRENLRIDSDPIERNQYINQSYFEIATGLQQCTESQGVGNWYHFAVWASVSGGKVIDGTKFEEMGRREKLGMWMSDILDWSSQEYITEVFERANTLIALEMIPLGKEFLKDFCQSNTNKSFSEFAKKLNKGSKHDDYVRAAFKQYYLAIKEKSHKTKIERIALASTLQVMGEQIRVDDNLDAVFKADMRLSHWGENNKMVYFGDLYVRLRSTQNGALQLGNIEPLEVPLHKNVSTSLIDSNLINIELQEYQTLLANFNLPIDVSNKKEFKETKTKDWSSWPERFKFLAAMFRAYITTPQLQQAPK